MRIIKATILSLVLLTTTPAAGAEIVGRKKITSIESVKKVTTKKLVKPAQPVNRGWDFLKAKLLKDGVKEWEIRSVYDNKNMPPMGVVYFSLSPKEAHAMYAGFYKDELFELGYEFLEENRRIFEAAEKKYKVSRYVIAAILLVETKYGKHTGDSLIINRLSRVGGIAKPSNIDEVFKKLNKEDSKVTYKEVEDRALHLEERFYPEILALFQMARKYNVNLLELKGSAAGAFGMPQFLPSTFLNHAVDGNADGHISLFNRADAIHSTANYLANCGWKNDAAKEAKEQVIWQYNHSQAYIDTVLAMSVILANMPL